MTTEEFYKKHLTVGSMLKRDSDGRFFEVVSIKENRLNGKPKMEYILQAESGSKLPSDSHWIDCYFSLV